MEPPAPMETEEVPARESTPAVTLSASAEPLPVVPVTEPDLSEGVRQTSGWDPPEGLSDPAAAPPSVELS